MKPKVCVGALITDGAGKIFLMRSPKWSGWIVPGGEKRIDESDEEALRREIREELGIEITNIRYVGKKEKSPSKDFYNHKQGFSFIDFIVSACSTDILPNNEVTEYGWFSIQEALTLNLVDSTRSFIENYKDLL